MQVWDVVDKGKKRIKLEGLKLAAAAGADDECDAGNSGVDAALDAQFLDVYKGAHGVIFLFDITKQWTFDYIQREIKNVPGQIPILVLANFIDKAHHRCITREQAVGFIEELGKKSPRTQVRGPKF